MRHDPDDVNSTTTWVRLSNRTGRAEINTALACHEITEAEHVGAAITVDADRRIVIDRSDPAERVTFTPAHVGVRPLPWQWELLARVADAPAFTGEFDRLGQIRLRLTGRLIDAVGSAMLIDRGWVTVTGGRGTVTAIGYLMLAHRLAAASA
ncbi:hypothetical protein [Glycomyces sp. YM15]|uniref:hypothetical protein n=1 Tax=Glycomyces sp. YM15 TaxID=2800446 RepID=UPI001963D727|nr:hypothetical protein [Glycomyces sp. YM15]